MNDTFNLGHISDRMQAARRQQNVNSPEFYGVSMDESDIIHQNPPMDNSGIDDCLEELSPFELAIRYTNEVWNGSFAEEKHIGQMWRKIPYHLPKAIATIKILRLFFRLMGDKMLYYLNSQEGNRSYSTKSIPHGFHQKLNQIFNEYFQQHSRTIELEKKKINVLLFTCDDVEAGYKWCQWKLQTTLTLFSTNQIQTIVNARLGKPLKTSSPSAKYDVCNANNRINGALFLVRSVIETLVKGERSEPAMKINTLALY